MRVETIGNATLYLGSCEDILPTLGRVDACITDPPYGIGEAAGKNKSRSVMAASKDYGNDDWDSAPPDASVIDALRGMSDWQALFGGNYFHLPPSSCWLVWDKLNGANDFADCELCWTNWPKAVRRLAWRWHGMIREGNEERHHPTQKPLEVMKWVIGLCPKADTILDPFMGSGTTGVAAIQMGRKFIGVEREERYFDIACLRIEQAVKTPALFDSYSKDSDSYSKVENCSLFDDCKPLISLENLAEWTGLEPATPGVTGPIPKSIRTPL